MITPSQKRARINGQAVHFKNGRYAKCGRFLTPFMLSSDSAYTCKVCAKAAREKQSPDDIFLTIHDRSYKFNMKNLRVILPKLYGYEYKVHKIHTSTYLTRMDFYKTYHVRLKLRIKPRE